MARPSGRAPVRNASDTAGLGWLASTPSWNEGWPSRRGFPADEKERHRVRRRAAAAGLVKTWTTYGDTGFRPGPSPHPIASGRRCSTRGGPETTHAGARRPVVDLGATWCDGARAVPDAIAPAAMHWAEIAQVVADPLVAGQRLYDTVAGLILAGDLVTAQDWVHAGESLTEVGGGPRGPP